LLESQFRVRLQLSQLFRLSTIRAITAYCQQYLPVDEIFVGALEPMKKNGTDHILASFSNSMDPVAGQQFEGMQPDLLDGTIDVSLQEELLSPVGERDSWEEGMV